jgi:hypothetical protein
MLGLSETLTEDVFVFVYLNIRHLGILFLRSLSYLIFVISFTQAKFSENEIYTQKHVNCKNGFCDKIA